MILHGYHISESALLEASNPYRLRALVQHQLKCTNDVVTREPLLKAFDDMLHANGFQTLKARLVAIESGQEADEFDDDLALFIDTDVVHHLTIQ